MILKLQLPFSEIIVKNAQDEHRVFFDSIYFSQKYDTPIKLKFVLSIDENIMIDAVQFAENMSVHNKRTILYDTKNIPAIIDSIPNKRNEIHCSVGIGYDLYYFFTFIIEPLLIINLAKHNVLFLHASSVAVGDKAYVMPAWRHTGKTRTVLEMLKTGAEFMSDDYTVIHKNLAYSYPKKINLFSYNFNDNPELYKCVGALTTVRLKLMLLIKNILSSISLALNGPFSKVFFRISQLAEVATNITIDPRNLCAVRTNAVLHNITMLINSSNKINQKMLTTEQAATKLTAVIQYELSDFFAMYTQSVFLTGEKQEAIDSFAQTYYSLVKKIIKDYAVTIKGTAQKSM